MLTGSGRVRDAVKAMKLGANDFLEKPYNPEELKTRISQMINMWKLENENRRLRRQIKGRFEFDALIGKSPAILKVKEMIVQVASTQAPVLIQGETGTGKELVARAIHFHSSRQNAPFVPVDCASISENVMTSELFGHVKGAFTGAHTSTPGLFRSAHTGTLFLDEVGELSLSMQVKLLRTIQEKEVRPVGGNKSYPVDVRLLSATNRDLKEAVAEGKFRQDLYYRLNVVAMDIPPLRNRIDDISLLATHFAKQFDGESTGPARMSKEALVRLNRYQWPGNVRELENAVRCSMALATGDSILPEDLPLEIGRQTSDLSQDANTGSSDSLVSYEKVAIKNALIKSAGNRKQAAVTLGIGEATLYRKLAKYKLT